MAEHVLGLDVGTSGVRVVEVCADPKHSHGGGDQPTVRAFGEVPLPPGAARDGEVVDPAAVGEAIRELWRTTGLRSRDVRVGLASQRVFVRTVEMPDLPDDELAGALRFSAQDHIPIPLDEAHFDFTVVERVVPEGAFDANPVLRVLVAAAHREAVDNLVAAAEAGGLRVMGVDLVPFALVRALAAAPVTAAAEGTAAEPTQPAATTDPDVPAEPAAFPFEPAGFPAAATTPSPTAEAIVSVGAGVTTVVVHEGGRPQFVRTVALGGQSLTEAIADELGVTTEAAEAAKCSDNPDDELAARAARVVEGRLATVLGEIQGSLSYWMAQSEAPIERVLLTGGGALAGDLAGRLGVLVGVPVEHADPRERLDVEVPDAGAGIDPFLSVAAGLALGGSRGPARSLIDLNPKKPRDPLFSRRILAGFGAAAAAVVLVLGGLTGLALHGASGARGRLAAQQEENAAVAAELAELDGLRQARARLVARRGWAQAALAGDVAWTRLLEDLAQGLPEGVWIGSFSADLGSPATPATPGTPDAPTAPVATTPAAAAPVAGGFGTASFSATGLDYPAVADWLERLPEQGPFAGVTVGSITRTDVGGRAIVNFSSTATVTAAAASDRAARLQEPQL